MRQNRDPWPTSPTGLPPMPSASSPATRAGTTKLLPAREKTTRARWRSGSAALCSPAGRPADAFAELWAICFTTASLGDHGGQGAPMLVRAARGPARRPHRRAASRKATCGARRATTTPTASAECSTTGPRAAICSSIQPVRGLLPQGQSLVGAPLALSPLARSGSTAAPSTPWPTGSLARTTTGAGATERYAWGQVAASTMRPTRSSVRERARALGARAAAVDDRDRASAGRARTPAQRAVDGEASERPTQRPSLPLPQRAVGSVEGELSAEAEAFVGLAYDDHPAAAVCCRHQARALQAARAGARQAAPAHGASCRVRAPRRRAAPVDPARTADAPPGCFWRTPVSHCT